MRLILDSPGDPYVNMARDLALFEGYLAGESPATWRCYTWNETAATFGRNQESPPGLEEIPVIKRVTGGGIVPHGADLTYSVVRERRSGNENYRDIIELLNVALRELGVDCSVWEGGDEGLSGVCFASLAPFDIHRDGVKIAGCAQRRKQDGILHHGSIAADAPAPVFVETGYYGPIATISLSEEIGRFVDWPEISELLINLSKSYLNGERLVIGEYSEQEKERADELAIELKGNI
ncbi:MAG: lipoate--protein ligase family protein [bacterium]|nr:lipoate--protein ligase family protein [bacterium]